MEALAPALVKSGTWGFTYQAIIATQDNRKIEIGVDRKQVKRLRDFIQMIAALNSTMFIKTTTLAPRRSLAGARTGGYHLFSLKSQVATTAASTSKFV